ncbi:hypothetical protein B0H11DRAFT_1907049 [Mycena galericulata]|nr:hypothetical protein B0H11DRAFT_1907049 [Mycena galericulata]
MQPKCSPRCFTLKPPMLFLAHDTWESQVLALQQSPGAVASRTILSTMTPMDLVATALRSRSMFRVIVEYLNFMSSNAVDDAEFTDDEDGSDDEETERILHTEQGFGIPAELTLRILSGLDIADQLRVARSSRHGTALAAVSLQDRASHLLGAFNLRFIDVRLLLAATGAVISGSAVVALLQPPRTSFQPADLDFFTCNDGGYIVARFLSAAAGSSYRQISFQEPYDFARGVSKVHTLQEEHGTRKIIVIEGYTSNPLDIVMHFHSTPVWGAWTSKGVWHGSPELTLRGIAITTPYLLPVENGGNNGPIQSILSKYIDRGFTFSFNEYAQPHICGVDLRCPATLRSSDDEGCLNFNWPTWDLSAHSAPFIDVSWAMRGGGCSLGIRAASGASRRIERRGKEDGRNTVSTATSDVECTKISYTGKASGGTSPLR